MVVCARRNIRLFFHDLAGQISALTFVLCLYLRCYLFMHLVHGCALQQLQGALPDSFGSLASLVSLDISKNQLAGEPFAVMQKFGSIVC